LGTSTRFKVPMFVDRTAPSDPSGAAYQIQFCLQQPQAATLGNDGLELDLWPGLTNPAANGAYAWRALVAPAAPDGTIDTAATYEVRSLLAVPSRITLNGRYDRRSRRALLTGRFIAPALDVGQTPISLYEFDPSEHVAPWSFLTWRRTDASGRFLFRRPMSQTTKFGARIEAIGDCSPNPLALAPCRDETLATIASHTVTVHRGKR
jgi:hypothetical protein